MSQPHIWYYLRSGLVQEVEEGPFDERQIIEIAKSGKINLRTKMRSPTRTQNNLIYAEDIPSLAVVINQAKLDKDAAKKKDAEERLAQKREMAVLKQQEKAALAAAKASQAAAAKESGVSLIGKPGSDEFNSSTATSNVGDEAAKPNTSAEITRYDESPSMFRNQPILFVACVLLCLVLIGIPILFFWWFNCKGTRLTITNKRVTLRRGIFSKDISEVRHADIKHFQITQTFFQRIFDVGSVAISSAGQAGVEIFVSGVPRPNDIRAIVNSHRD
ncbi:MAG TPA: PH domain-containing protein [Pirellulaceae bacterium]|nr:PH domain-containing protein [Pirellulaceae bacterium]